MKLVKFAPFALVFATLTACGTDQTNANLVSDSQPELLEGAAAQSELYALGFSSDACTISLPQATYTLAQGGKIRINYSFFKLSGGDRVRISRVSDGQKVWGSQELSQASGVLEVDVASLGKGDFRIQGYLNTYKTDQQADCGPNVRVVVRVK